MAETAIPLIKKNLLGFVEKNLGISLDPLLQHQGDKSLLDSYMDQRATKDKLKEELRDLSAKVANDTGHPLVFIVDELDRCRPTFAIELLERVKHIFDVPNIVFVFGLNRDELCKSLTSVYGEIDADVYLRRFFDFEFNLPEADSREFAVNLMTKFGLDRLPQVIADRRFPVNATYYRDFIQMCAMLWSGLRLSLRDVDYGIRLLALVAKSDAINSPANPHLLALLICIKFKNPELYSLLRAGNFQASSTIDYMARESGTVFNLREFNFCLDRIEGLLYCVDSTNTDTGERGAAALDELDRGVGGSSGSPSFYLSLRAQQADQSRREQIRQAILDGRKYNFAGQHLGNWRPS